MGCANSGIGNQIDYKGTTYDISIGEAIEGTKENKLKGYMT
jgi:hypothetical protein